jgi:hypothetical protein
MCWNLQKKKNNIVEYFHPSGVATCPCLLLPSSNLRVQNMATSIFLQLLHAFWNMGTSFIRNISVLWSRYLEETAFSVCETLLYGTFLLSWDCESRGADIRLRTALKFSTKRAVPESRQVTQTNGGSASGVSGCTHVFKGVSWFVYAY